MHATALHIGTADWRHASWRGRYYPAPLPEHAWLPHYAREFNAVELDGGRLAQLDANLAATWCSSVSPDFRFCVQLPRVITHVRRLRNVEAQLMATLDKARLLGDRLGPILVSLPPRWHRNLQRLEQFMDQLPGDLRYAFEFLDTDWLHPSSFALLQSRDMALVINDRMPIDHQSHSTCDMTYVRLYGPSQQRRYTAVTMRSWAIRLAGWQRHGLTRYVLAQAGPEMHAIKHARLLRDYEQLLGHGAGPSDA